MRRGGRIPTKIPTQAKIGLVWGHRAVESLRQHLPSTYKEKPRLAAGLRVTFTLSTEPAARLEAAPFQGV